MHFKTEILKTGRNKFEVGDTVINRGGNTYVISSIYNDFTYSMISTTSSSIKIPIVSDKGFSALPLKRTVLVEKVIIRKLLVDPHTGEIDLKYDPVNVQEDYYLTIRA
jgi:hypothetical protein